MRWVSSAVMVLTSAISILVVVAAAAVVLGIA
jgi:hypothetical protein